MRNVVVDFESYYDSEISVSEIGLPNYVRQTEAYLVALAGPGINYCGSPADMVRSLPEVVAADDIQFWAFNANFDQALWEKRIGKPVRPWKCISDLSAFHQYPRQLAKVSEVVLGEKVDKQIRDRMKGVRWESLPESEQNDVRDYCLNDALVEEKILNKLGPMTEVEDQVAAHTRAINRRGVHIDMEKVDRDSEALHRIKHETYHTLPWTSFCETPLSYARFAEYCQENGVTPPKSLDKRDEACTHWIKVNPHLAPVVHSMRTYRGANTKLEKIKKLTTNVTPEGVLPLELLYCGARHTRRWSSVGFNVQNLDKAPVFGEIMAAWPEFSDPQHLNFDAESDPGIFLRSYLVPPPGKKFGILDFSQIEPRCLNWLVGNEEMLEGIRAGYSIYEAHAKATMGWKGAPGTLKGQEKHFAKIRVLALGYGMGAVRFEDTARQAGIKLDDAEAEAQVNDFRATNSRITGMWKQFDKLIWGTTQSSERTVAVEMPTGEMLRQFHVRPKQNGGGFESFTIRGDYSQQSRQPNLWGGTLTENVTQRMARDVLAYAILRLEKEGFPVVFHAHDEVILNLDSGSAEKDFEEAKQIMSIAPDWCPDLPVAVDGGIFDHYTKMS